MAPQHDGKKRKGRFPHPTRSSTQTYDEYDTDDDDNDNDDSPSSTVSSTFTGMPIVDSPWINTKISAEPTATDYQTRSRSSGHPLYNGPTPGLPSDWPKPSSWETSTFPPAQSDNLKSTTPPASPTMIGSYSYTPLSSGTGNDIGGPHPDQPWTQEHGNNTTLYAVASIVPAVLLAVVGIVICVCLRRRKRRREEDAKITIQEMKIHAEATVLEYVVPQVTARRASSSIPLPPTSTPSQLQPVIIGPILSSSNGAYMTGLDTSDMVSITSNNVRPVDPFADNNSLEEPPPPYRPRSVAPPSFVSTSRQSSLRSHDYPPSTSQTQLIERSPFEDPNDDVSVGSGSAQERSDDSTSTVTDMSYQHDPMINRSALS
ncbi:hypothetical protein IAQ61_005279 [Plenodomus lingam]|uniref:Uncharacterized protein n=1 Tax=Leptosphaeria maculans (strain JN3 / isolate v23.1.3 / race Av1-4-5-6-7-8) TaxID=985895 RepID=E5A775_LEPMJ|nr:predicted protein [Plenodomus lingam JN3]KAH9872443.1 hypothetical protein IAQ61_005279 [Plenodomus lingam]CBX99470.1 predicted protein [Plenodomus lingam JN3]